MNLNLIQGKWFRGIILTIMLACVIVGTFFFYDYRYRECTSNPLIFAAKLYEEAYSRPFRGTATFEMDDSPVIIFDAYNVTVQKTISSSYLSNLNPSSLNISPNK